MADSDLKFASDGDRELYQKMLAFARQGQGTEHPIMPIFRRHDGTVAVEKMRTLPCFGDLWQTQIC